MISRLNKVKKNQRMPMPKKSNTVSLKWLRFPLFFLLIIIMYQITVRLIEPNLFPIRHLHMGTSHHYLNPNNLQKLISPYVKGFFTTDMMKLKSVIMQSPFIDNVVIKRRWPDTLSVQISEVKVIAQWGKDEGVTSKGEIVHFNLAKDSEIPVFSGPETQVGKMVDQYNQFSELLNPLGVNISELSLNQRHSWQMTLNNGITLLLGRKDVPSQLASFLAIYPRIKKIHGNKIETIDLRHSNGFSVHLKDSK